MRLLEGEPIPAITAFGKRVGSRRMTNVDLDRVLGRREGVTDRMMKKLGIGIDERPWINPGIEATSDLAVGAIEEALEQRGIEGTQLGGVFVATTSPDYLGKSTAAIIQYKAGLPTNIFYSNNSDACPGWVIAAQYAVVRMSSIYGLDKPHIVVGVEVPSPFLSPKKGAETVLFGDAAGATIWENVIPDEGAPTIIQFAFGADGQYAPDLGVEAGGSAFPTSWFTLEEDLHSIDMNGPVVFEQAVRRMSEVSKQALNECGVPIEEISLFVPHQANRKIIEATADVLGIPIKKVMITIQEYGNTSSASIPIALYDAFKQGRLKRNDIVVVASFGAGLVYAAGAFSMNGLPKS